MTQRRYQKEQSRTQETLFPPSVEEYVVEDNPVRALDAYVDSLNIEKFGFAFCDSYTGAGQPPYPPGALLKLYLYGYLNRVRSSRRLEREAHRNVELFWLLKGLKPSYKTIASFRKDNPDALRRVNREFVELCKKLDLFSNELVAIDGSFFRANASKKSIYTPKRLKRQVAAINRDINDYLNQLDQMDRNDEACSAKSDIEAGELSAKIDALREELKEKESLQDALLASGETQLGTVDTDARLLTKRGTCIAGYNVQTSVDAKNKLITVCEVVQDGNDQNQLAPIAIQTKETLEIETLTVLADSGYFKGEQIKECIDEGITPYVPEPNKSGAIRQGGRYTRDQFSFDHENNRYLCPAGEYLIQIGQPYEKRGQMRIRYSSRGSLCNQCSLRGQCLTKKAQRKNLTRWVHESVLESHRERMEGSREKMIQRSALAEHPFGTLKRWCGMDHFLVRGLKKVRGEMSLMILGYNLTRVMNIFGVTRFMELLKAPQTAV